MLRASKGTESTEDLKEKSTRSETPDKPSFFFRTTSRGVYHSKLLAGTKTDTVDAFYDVVPVTKHVAHVKLDRPDRKLAKVDVLGKAGLNENRWYPDAPILREKLAFAKRSTVPFSKLTGRNRPASAHETAPNMSAQDAIRVDFRESDRPPRPKSVPTFASLTGRDTPTWGKLGPGVVEQSSPRIPYSVSDRLTRRRAQTTIPFSKMPKRRAIAARAQSEVEYDAAGAKDRILARRQSVSFNKGGAGRPTSASPSIAAHLQYNADSPLVHRRAVNVDFAKQSSRPSLVRGTGGDTAKQEALDVARPSTAPPGASGRYRLPSREGPRPKSRQA